VGYDKPKPGGRGFTGGAIAAPIWEKFMRGVVSARPVGDFIQPEGVLKLTIDPANGYLANSECPQKVEEFFIAGTEPEKSCDKHGGVPLNPDLEEITLPEEVLAPTPVEIKP
jgi:membrane carboxypeptidase/penicillin-binding protein